MTPLRQQEVHFTNIREVDLEFLQQHKSVHIRDIQWIHLGQDFVGFEHVYDLNNLIAQSPHPYGDVYAPLVKHNEGGNWRLLEYNKECWLMLLGFPMNYWSTNHIQNALAPFGRVLNWENNHTNFARLLVKARVTNLEDVPRFIVISETEGFQGQSWTIQCEIIHQNLLEALPANEDQLPGDDQHEIDPAFDFFGLGQPVNDVAFHGHEDQQ
jgi:hypothetical protein